MSLLSVREVSKAFGARRLWQGLSAEVPHQARIGVTGASDSGRSTLLRILAGREAPDRGRVLRARHVRVGWPSAAGFRRAEAELSVRDYCLQAFAEQQAQEITLARLENELDDPHRAAALYPRFGALQEAFEHRGGSTYRTKARQVMEGLGFRAGRIDQKLGELSAAGRMRARLGRVLLEDPDLLLLDEPARNLTRESCAWLARWLREWPGAVVCVAPAGEEIEADLDTAWRLTARGWMVTTLPRIEPRPAQEAAPERAPQPSLQAV